MQCGAQLALMWHVILLHAIMTALSSRETLYVCVTKGAKSKATHCSSEGKQFPKATTESS